MPKEVVLARFELMVARGGPPKIPKCLENGQLWDKKWAKNGTKMCLQMITFLSPLNALIPKLPFSFLADFLVWLTSKAWGSISVGFRGSRQWSPFLGEREVQLGGSNDPPPSSIERPTAPELWPSMSGTAQWDCP